MKFKELFYFIFKCIQMVATLGVILTVILVENYGKLNWSFSQVIVLIGMILAVSYWSNGVKKKDKLLQSSCNCRKEEQDENK